VAAKTARRLRFELTGPGIIDKSYETAGIAISAAITAADHHEGEAEFLVRDVTDEVVGKTWKDKHGVTRCWRAPFIGAGS
jgi:hypothetical protein